jgi:D-aminopeptidase
MLHGSPVEAPFGDAEAAKIIAGTRTLQFEPGTSYSYVNQNFRILSDIVQARTGRTFATLLRDEVFEPAGMASAFLAAETRAMPDGTEGYEGSQAGGFRAAENNILWTGDAGMGASLDDMIAWERHIDATRDDPSALYARLSRPVAFADGTPAAYGFGLSRQSMFGRETTGHGGALRGWRSHRAYLPAQRVSIVVLFNHMADASVAAKGLLAAVLDETSRPQTTHFADPDWLGTYFARQTGLATHVQREPDGKIRLGYQYPPDALDLQADGSAGDGKTTLRIGEGGLWMDRTQENSSALLVPMLGEAALDIEGEYRCDELAAKLTIIDSGGVLYGAFSGFLGAGRMELLNPLAADLWALPCPRALDHSPPGDWTLRIARDVAGRPRAIEVGCWLARRLRYDRFS